MPSSSAFSRHSVRISSMIICIVFFLIMQLWLTCYWGPDDNHNKEEQPLPVVVIAACMDRGSTVSVAARSWFAADGISQIIIVDWSSNPPVSTFIPELLLDSRLKLITVQDEDKWVLSWAYNLAAKCVRPGSLMLKVDCDTVFSFDFLAQHPLKEGIFYAGDWRVESSENAKHLNGIFYINHSYFMAIHGFDERIQTYGNDDTDLYERLNASGLTLVPFDLTTVYHLDHPSSLRSSKQSIRHVNFESQKNRMLKALLPAWNRSSPATSFKLKSNPKRPGHYLARRTSKVPSIESMVPNNVSESIERTAAQIVLRQQHVPWASLGLPTAYLIKMIPSYDKGKMLIVHVQHGLGNRLRAMASGIAVSSKTGRHFRLIWIPDEHCNARFQDLFSNNIDVWYDFERLEVAADNFDRYNYMEPEADAVKGKKILTDTLNHIYVKTAYMLNHDEVNSSAVHEAFSKLDLKPHIAAKVNSIDATTLIGVHIRNVDPRKEILGLSNSTYTSEAWKQLSKSRQTMQPSMFIAEIDNIVDKHPTQRFFISADSETTVTEFKKRYKNQIEFLDRNGCQDRSERCLAFAIADLWILSRTKKLLGSLLSSFSEVAGLIGNITVNYAGLQFPDLPSDHRVRKELLGQGNGIIYIAYSSSENWRIQSESKWRTQELLHSVQSVHNLYRGSLPIALFTDYQTNISKTSQNMFKYIYSVNVSRTSEGELVKDALNGVAKGKPIQIPVSLGKIQQLAQSPFEITLYLDSDTWLCHQLNDFHRILADHDIMFAKDTHLKSKTHWAWNSGVILYKNCPAVIQFFRLWEELYLQECIVSGTNRKDTCALTSALERSPLLRYGTLDSVYNFRLGNENWADSNWKPEKLRSQVVRWPVNILHTTRMIAHQSNETCALVNKHRLLPRILGVTSSKQPSMYYTKTECVHGTENNCDVDFF